MQSPNSLRRKSLRDPSGAGNAAPGRELTAIRRGLAPSAGTGSARAGQRAREKRLLDAARSGDARAMRALLDEVSPTVYRFGRSFCRNPHDAEDVMQDVFAALARSLGAFRGDASLSTWAYVVAQRACARRRRRDRAARFTPLDAPAVERALHDPAADPAAQSEAGELREVLEEAIRSLPAPQRDVLMLRDVEGRPAREVARSLGLAERAMKSRLHRARRAVRARIEAYRRGARPRRGRGCPDTPLLLSRFVEGDMSAGACASLEKHVAACPQCGETCAALRDALHACRDWRDAPVPRAMRTRLRRAVRAAAGGMPDRASPRRRRRRTATGSR